MTNPAVCLYAGNSFSFSECEFVVMTDAKPLFLPNNIKFAPHPKWRNEIERFSNIASTFHNAIEEIEPEYIGIEGYSMGSRGMVFNIGENTGILKYMLYQNLYSFETIAPTKVKKFATGSGRADKVKMCEAFTQETGIDLGELIFNKPNRVTSPISDIADSYWIAKFIFDKYS